jgi:Spy/CpxP family protein refolding chaperone
MRKTRVFALVVASLVSTASIAGAQAPGRQGGGGGRHAMGAGMGAGARGLMRGISLTEAEKARLKEIHVKYRAEGNTLRESLRPSMEAARAARQRGDTAAARAAFDRSKGAREKARALRERERAEIRGALTPEHQRQLDANVQQLEKRRADGAKQGKGKRGDRMGRRGERLGRLG